MKPLLEHPRADRMGWNIRADDRRLINKGFNLLDETLGFDGMKAIAFFDSRWAKGLEFGIKKFTNYRPYYNRFNIALREHKLSKDAMSDLLFLAPDVFLEYAAGDAVSHREACINMRKMMKRKVPREVQKYYFATYLPLSHYLTDLELSGLPIDVEFMTKITEQYSECYKALQTKLSNLTKKWGFDTEQRQQLVAELGEETVDKSFWCFNDFNPRSYIDKSRLFYDVMELTPAYYVKKGKTKPKAWYDKQKDATKKQYSPSTNGKAIASSRFLLADQIKQLEAKIANPPEEFDLEEAQGQLSTLKSKYEVVATYLDLARVGVFSTKFLSTQGVTGEGFDVDNADIFDDDGEEETLKSSYWAALGEGNKIYPDFYECLDNFRSSSRPNVQNPASKVLSHIPKIFQGLNLEPPKNIRNIFYSGDKDWYFAEVDVAGADLAIAAFLSQDPEYIKDILNGGFHTTKMREYFKDPKLGKDDASKYVTSKAITFRVAYTAGLMSAAIPIQAEIFAESGNHVDLEVIKYALETWRRYKTYMTYRENCQQQVEDACSITNARGMTFQFEKTSNFAIKAGWMNQSLAYPIASELALMMWEVCVKLKQRLVKDGVWMKYVKPNSCIHDALNFVLHKDLMKDNYFPEVCRQIFTKDVKIATGDNLGIEMVVSDCWKGKEKVFSKETKWNFKEKCWEWGH